MQVPSKLVLGLCSLALAGSFAGCGSDDAGPSGRLVQGPVLNATVFADNVSGGVRFAQDANEVSTTTSTVTGDFELPSTPGYNYILVSKGGIDKLTEQPAIQMIAPAGSANITPLTTLVALDTTGTVKAKLQSLGVSYDADISTTASPAAILVVKSVETMVQSLTQAVVASAGSDTISAEQIATVQAQTMQAIATEFAKPGVTATTLTTTASLSTALQSAATTAATNIGAANTNITIPAGTATTIASSSVTATAGALSIGATASTGTVSGGETALITPTAAQAFVDAVAAESAAAAATITATETPTSYTPPTIPVVTPVTVIDTTGTTGGTSGGTGVTF